MAQITACKRKGEVEPAKTQKGLYGAKWALYGHINKKVLILYCNLVSVSCNQNEKRGRMAEDVRPLYFYTYCIYIRVYAILAL